MAANDYYYGGDSNNPTVPSHHRTPSPYGREDDYSYGAQTSGITTTTTPTPHQSSLPVPPNADRPQQHTSPFDTVFDDHAYPLDPRQQSSSASSCNNNHNNNSSMGNLSGQSTEYYGAGPASSPDEGRAQRVDDIPLQNRPGKDVEMGNDHVYDAPSSGRPTPTPQKKKKRGNIGLGQLGMFGSDSKRIPWVVYIFSIVHIAVFIGMLVRNATLTGTPIMIKPSFNPMIGPSTWVMVNMGARYVPCMHNVDKIQGSTDVISWPCPNTTTTDAKCSLSELCGFGGIPEPNYDGNKDQKPEPNQWFRFITPIFMHAGLIHIGFNLLLQLTIGKEMERAIGSIRFFLVYMSSGIFGFVMGGNYAGEGIPSTGASGALFGIIALLLIDLLYSWQERRSPVKDLLFIILDVVIAFVLGLLPGLDNFSHIGGFIMGLGLGICLLHSPNALRRRLGPESSYTAVQEGTEGPVSFVKSPMGFFKGRKPLWWAWWLVRAGCLLSVTIGFIVLLNNFYVYRNSCSWCKYLSCVPINDWCEIGNLQISKDDPTDTNAKREVVQMLTGVRLPL